MREQVQWFADQLNEKARNLDVNYLYDEGLDVHWLIDLMRDRMMEVRGTSPDNYDDMINSCVELAYFTMLMAYKVKENRYENEWEDLRND